MRRDIATELADALNRLMLPRNRGALCAPVIAAAPAGVDAQTYPLLVTLERLGPSTAARLGAEIGIDRSGTSRYADRLVDLGLVRRGPDPADGRGTLLSLTSRGTTLIRRLNDILADHLHAQVSQWPRGQAESLADGLELLLGGATPARPAGDSSAPRA